jgi:hypothetical protein
MAYAYLDGWTNYALGVVVWLMYTSTAGQIMPSGKLYGLCIPRRLGRLYPRECCMAYVYLDCWIDYTLAVVAWLMHTSTVWQIIPLGYWYGLCIPRRLGRSYPRVGCMAYAYLDCWTDYTLGGNFMANLSKSLTKL